MADPVLLEVERARATAALAARLTQTTNTIGATVTQTPYTDNTGFVAVHLDGDPPGYSVLLPFTGPWAPYAGERCLVLESPNGGMTVVGPLGPTPSRTWTPTVSGTGWGIGNGTTSGLWERIGNWVLLQGNVVFGSTSTFGAGSQLTLGGLPLPVRNAGITLTVPLYMRANATDYPGVWRPGPNAQSGPVSYQLAFAAPGPVSWAATSNVLPNAWANGNFIDIGPVLYPVV